MDLHGASLTATSDGIGRGTSFTIEMPTVSTSMQEILPGSTVIPSSASNGHQYRNRRGSNLRYVLRCLCCLNSLYVPIPNSKVDSNESVKVAPEPSHKEFSNEDVLCEISDCENLRCKDNFEVCADVGHDGSGLFVPRINYDLTPPVTDLGKSIPDSERLNAAGSRTQKNDVSLARYCGQSPAQNSVLIVDDAPLNRKMMRRILESRFDSLAEAENGQQALDMVRASLEQGEDARYDVITMDYQMPVMDGVTATRRIRQLGYTGQIIGVTGNSLGEDVNTFLSSGANVVLTKPFTIAAFYEYLRSITSNR